MVIPDACINCAHHVSKTNDTVVVRFTTFKHCTMFYRNREALKGGVTFHLDLTKSRLDLLMKANKYVKDISNVDFAYPEVGSLGSFLNKVLRKDSGPGVLFVDFAGFLGAPGL